MKKEYRVKKSRDIDEILKLKRSNGNRYFVIYKSEKRETNEHFRFAISIGKKFGNAVMRNRAKRQIREIVKRYKALYLPYDFVIVVKPVASTLNFEEMVKELTYAIKKSQLTRGDVNEA